MSTQQCFVAVQCFQCSTMQVKQQKKSSNKWVCVVCNERQSVRRVHARGPLARDVRGFVQQFNMSRMESGSDGRGSISFGIDTEEFRTVTDGPSSPSRGGGRGGCRRETRTDWSEYLDLEESEVYDEKGDSEPEVVTEIPKQMSGRHFLKRRPEVRRARREGTEAFRPVFSKRKQQENHSDPVESKLTRMTEISGSCSKWSEYLERTNEEILEEERSSPPPRPCGSGGGDRQYSDLRVEEEVHPDFQ